MIDDSPIRIDDDLRKPAPVGDRSKAMTRDCFEPRSALFGSGSPAPCRDDFVVGTVAGADAVGRFFAGFDIEILRSVSRRRAAPPKPHRGDAAGGAGISGRPWRPKLT